MPIASALNGGQRACRSCYICLQVADALCALSSEPSLHAALLVPCVLGPVGQGLEAGSPSVARCALKTMANLAAGAAIVYTRLLSYSLLSASC